MCMALAVICGSAQQKGDMAVGLNLGVAPCLESGAKVTNFGLGAKFQYNLTNPVRLEAALDYGFKSKGADVMTFGVNAHYLFNVAGRLNVYPIVGLGYAHCGLGGSVDSDDDSDYSRAFEVNVPGYEEESVSVSANKFYFNVGAGAEYPITDKLSASLELKYQYIKNFSRLPISIGVTYKF